MEEKRYSFGIDLGTTNSAISVYRGREGGGSPEIIKDLAGKTTIPSCVMLENGTFTVGQEAYERRDEIDKVVYSVKRMMGTGKSVYLTDTDGTVREFSPTEISAEILKEVKRRAERLYGKVEDVTITVPAYFNNTQRTETIKAGQLAGLNVVNIINEPTSASLAYGLDKAKESENVLVYDLGGGTFDVTLLKIIKENKEDNREELFEMFDFEDETAGDNTVIRVLSNSGNNKLGGDDIDENLFNLLAENIDKYYKEEYGKKIKFAEQCSEKYKEELLLKLEKFKKIDSTGSFQIKINTKLERGSNEVIDDSFVVNAKTFDRAIKPIWESTLAGIRECINTSEEKNFSKIILVGGSTKLEQIREGIEKEFPDTEIYYDLNPDESIALGASIQTYITKGGENFSVFDVIPLPIGVKSKRQVGSRLIDNHFSRMINKDSLLPVEVSRSFNLSDEGDIVVEVYQGVESIATDNVKLGDLVLDDADSEGGQVSVKMSVDVNGILTVKVMKDGKEVERELKSVFGLNQEGTEGNKRDKRFSRWERNLTNWNIDETDRENALALLRKVEEEGEDKLAELREEIKRLSIINRERGKEVEDWAKPVAVVGAEMLSEEEFNKLGKED